MIKGLWGSLAILSGLGPDDPGSKNGFQNTGLKILAKIRVAPYKMTTRRLGSRYGKRVRDRLRAIETLSKQSYKCPYCHNLKVRRVTLGIFYCTKCRTKFTGMAYRLRKLKPAEQGEKDEPSLDVQTKDSVAEEEDNVKPAKEAQKGDVKEDG